MCINSKMYFTSLSFHLGWYCSCCCGWFVSTEVILDLSELGILFALVTALLSIVFCLALQRWRAAFLVLAKKQALRRAALGGLEPCLPLGGEVRASARGDAAHTSDGRAASGVHLRQNPPCGSDGLRMPRSQPIMSWGLSAPGRGSTYRTATERDSISKTAANFKGS